MMGRNYNLSRKVQRHLSPGEKQERKERVLTQGAASITRSIADAVVIKDDNVFFLTEPDGSVPVEDVRAHSTHGFGLYYNDCRYLNGYELKLAGTVPTVLVSTAERGFEAVFQLTNQDIRMEDGTLIAAKEEIGIKWERLLDGEQRSLFDRISFDNFTLHEVRFPVSLTFSALFEDIYDVRGLLPERLGELIGPAAWKEDTLSFIYRGADDLFRSLAIVISPKPMKTEGTTAHFEVVLNERETTQFSITLTISESNDEGNIPIKREDPSDRQDLQESLKRRYTHWIDGNTRVQTDSLLLNRVLDRSLYDLRLLVSHTGEKRYFAAGVPWFATLFGRDSVITSIETLAFDPEIAESTLRVLASLQGKEFDRWKNEEPGKILHALRVGELARAGEIPHSPYYGTVDATPLFLILLCRHASWTGDLRLFDELRESAESALKWISDFGDSDGDGYIDYKSTSSHGLVNQGWKDSGNAIVNADGSMVRPPVALVEVQGYVYQAKVLLAELYRRAGEESTAERLKGEADDLRARFNRDYWLEDKGFYALAFQTGKEPSGVVSSNPGHALWTGIADEDKARMTMERLMAEDMFSGWGIRTLSTREVRYNPVSYHLGSVWPHDNAIIAAGFRRYGFDDAAHRIFRGIVDAATYFEHYRLPELFSGFSRDDYQVPVRYPVACHPQAWGAGAVPYLVKTMLGLKPEAFEKRLRILHPLLPDYVDRIEVNGLRVGPAKVDLRFERSNTGVSVRIVKVEGDLDIVVET